MIGETAAVYRSLGQPQRALESMQSLVETYSPGEEPQQVLYWTGLDYMALRRYDDAVASLTAAVSRDRPTPELFYQPGRAQYRSGRSQEAAAALQQALAIDPQHAPSRQLLGEIQVAQQGGPRCGGSRYSRSTGTYPCALVARCATCCKIIACWLRVSPCCNQPL